MKIPSINKLFFNKTYTTFHKASNSYYMTLPRICDNSPSAILRRQFSGGNSPAGNSPQDNSPLDNSPAVNSPADNSPVDNSPADNMGSIFDFRIQFSYDQCK